MTGEGKGGVHPLRIQTGASTKTEVGNGGWAVGSDQEEKGLIPPDPTVIVTKWEINITAKPVLFYLNFFF